MNEKKNKISVVEWGIALAIIAIIATIILPQFISVIQTSGIPIYYILLSALFFVIPIIVFTLLHYFILRKTLEVQYPFQQLRKYPHINPNSLHARFNTYMTMFFLTQMIFFSMILLDSYFNLKELISQLGAIGVFLLLFAPITTVMLLIFSNHFFAKPVKETWKAIVLAGIIAGASCFALSYGLWKLTKPYLPVRAGTAQQVTK